MHQNRHKLSRQPLTAESNHHTQIKAIESGTLLQAVMRGVEVILFPDCMTTLKVDIVQSLQRLLYQKIRGWQQSVE